MMIESLPLFPVYVVDFIGALLMVIFSLIAFFYARRLTILQPKSVLWTYMFWFSMALVALAVSRGVGHTVRFVLLYHGMPGLWKAIAPFSGGLNTITFTSVAVLTFYYSNVRDVIDRVKNDAEALYEANVRLQNAQEALRRLNQNLEQMVEERTRELRQSEKKFRGLFEGSKDMIFFCNSDHLIEDINPSAVELLGFKSREEVIGRPFKDFFKDEKQWEMFKKELCEKGHIKDIEAELVRPDGSTRHVILTISEMKDENGNIRGCEGIGKDITKMKQVTESLIQSEKMASVGQLAAGVAHEINTPLGIILGYAQLLEEECEDNKDALESLKIIEKQTKICKRIVGDLLKFSRSSSDSQITDVDVNECVNEVLAVTEHSLNMDRIYINKNLAESLPHIKAKKEKLRQVIINLLNNAHHAIEHDGIIGIWTEYDEEKDEIRIIIGDTGEGIPPEIQGKIFDPFFTTKSVGKGTGLGLSVSFGIIKDHGGYIEAQSPPKEKRFVNAGMETVMIIHLPVHQENLEDEQ
ncbi:MAG: PAS domain S-box protein [Thermodesulfobacteria bacterium]|nr:PAS domain S-box protein [Thermodesulfobacteriota bacterium]